MSLAQAGLESQHRAEDRGGMLGTCAAGDECSGWGFGFNALAFMDRSAQTC